MEAGTRDKVDKAVFALPIEDVRNFMNRVAEVLYYDAEEKRWDVDKEWSSDEIDMICQLLPHEIRDAVMEESA